MEVTLVYPPPLLLLQGSTLQMCEAESSVKGLLLLYVVVFKFCLFVFNKTFVNSKTKRLKNPNQNKNNNEHQTQTSQT